MRTAITITIAVPPLLPPPEEVSPEDAVEIEELNELPSSDDVEVSL